MNILLGITAILLFMMGVAGFLLRRNPFVMLMSIELMLIGVNLGLVTIGRILQNVNAQILVLFIIAVAAAKIVLGLGIIFALFSNRDDVDADNINLLKG